MDFTIEIQIHNKIKLNTVLLFNYFNEKVKVLINSKLFTSHFEISCYLIYL